MEQALLEIAKQAPLTALLIIAVRYLVKENKTKDQEIKELNMIIRDQQKEGIEAMGEVNGVLKELTTIIKYGKGKEKT